MEAAPKRVRRGGGGSAPDRLSALSDDLLRRVLSFLPSRFAVQTCVLSKRWIDLWRSVPAVQLDINDFVGFDAGINGWRKMKDFANEFLMLHSTERLDVFRLVVARSCRTPEDFQRWARCGLNRQPLVLHIICILQMYWKDLRISRLSSAFCRLKRMDLSFLSLDHSFGDTLNSGCPVLEDLVLYFCRHEFDVIQSDTLKNLSVDCFSQVGDLLVIRAPCLASLCLGSYNYKNCFSLEAGNSLVRAAVSVSVHNGETSQRGQTILLGSLFNVSCLELGGFSAMAILDKELDKFPTFDNLRTLSLKSCFVSEQDVDQFKAIGRFLQKSPNLEKLALHYFWYIEEERQTSDESMLRKVKPVVGPNEFHMLGNLRTLFLDECDLQDNFRILRHFLQRCPNLEKLTIRLCMLPEASTGGKGVKLKTTGKGAKSKKTHSGFRNLVRIQCCKLKSTEIIYKKGVKIQELVSLLLDISECAPMNTTTLTKYEEAMDMYLSD
ncbi:hypothetical protein BDA96_06G097500 [Sorghum bicolor]|uniref:F-box domain-containing protein n=1 Tax=Sorghum bicolor TaxID=4558 RepID=A0A921UBW9_SORBI|nr:hypothetical protein BDA96_06G097500 [Sorghum bicolor]